MIYKTIDDLSQPLTPEQIKMLQEAASMDIPEEFTDEELKEFKRVSQGRHAASQKKDAMKAAIRREQNDNTSATAIRKAQSAFEGAAEALGLSDEDDVQALIDEVRYENS